MDLKENNTKSNKKPIIRYFYLITVFFSHADGLREHADFQALLYCGYSGTGMAC